MFPGPVPEEGCKRAEERTWGVGGCQSSLQGRCTEDGAGLSAGGRERSNGLALQKGKLRFEMRNNFLRRKCWGRVDSASSDPAGQSPEAEPRRPAQRCSQGCLGPSPRRHRRGAGPWGRGPADRWRMRAGAALCPAGPAPPRLSRPAAVGASGSAAAAACGRAPRLRPRHGLRPPPGLPRRAPMALVTVQRSPTPSATSSPCASVSPPAAAERTAPHRVRPRALRMRAPLRASPLPPPAPSPRRA